MHMLLSCAFDDLSGYELVLWILMIIWLTDYGYGFMFGPWFDILICPMDLLEFLLIGLDDNVGFSISGTSMWYLMVEEVVLCKFCVVGIVFY